MQRVLTTVTLLGLLVATAAAFAITEHLKLIKSPVYGTLVSKELSPVCGCSESKATIRIRLRHRDRVTVRILDSGGGTVVTVASSTIVPPRRAVSFVWGGRTAAGAMAPDGAYHPEIHLADAHRTILFPNRIILDSRTPKVLAASDGSGILFVGPGRGIAIHYAFSEPAHAVVYLHGQRIVSGRSTQQHAAVKWSGKLNGRSLRAGAYVLSVAARDPAGNETPPAGRRSVRVVVRYIDVAPRRISVRAGDHLAVRVETRAPRYTWRLGRRSGANRDKLLRLLAPTTPGTYRLVVAEQGHTATVLVRVRAK